MDKPIMTKRVGAGTRIYYFDVHKDSKGQPYLAVTEEPVGRRGTKLKRQRIFVHIEDFGRFASAFSEIAEYIKSLGDEE